jgi:hypothetical protein
MPVNTQLYEVLKALTTAIQRTCSSQVFFHIVIIQLDYHTSRDVSSTSKLATLSVQLICMLRYLLICSSYSILEEHESMIVTTSSSSFLTSSHKPNFVVFNLLVMDWAVLRRRNTSVFLKYRSLKRKLKTQTLLCLLIEWQLSLFKKNLVEILYYVSVWLNFKI